MKFERGALMRKADCPHCKCSVTSPFMTESREIECPNCVTLFTAKDVFVATGPYSIYREVLIRSMHKYVRLLREARAEIRELEELGVDSLPYRESAKTIKVFVENLRELLGSCRDKLRVSGGKATVDYYMGEDIYRGVLKNISSTGICMAVPQTSHRIGPGRIIKLRIKDESLSEPLCLRGWVVWSTEKGITGIKFVSLDESAREALHKFISFKGSLEDLYAPAEEVMDTEG